MHGFIQQQLDRALGRVLTGCVGVEIHRDVAAVALQHPHLGIGQRRPATGDHLGNARGVDADRVHVAFHQNGAVPFADPLLGAMEVVQDVALLVHRSLGRVEILRIVLRFERTAAEPDCFA